MTLIKTITPVHVGSGNVYQDEFIVKDGYVLRLNTEKLVRIIPGNKMDNFLSGIGNIPLHELLKGLDIRDAVRYRVKANGLRPNKIREHIKTGEVPFIPGSSIKGAIRTALLWYFLKEDDSFIEHIRKSLGWAKKRNIATDFVNNFFSFNPGSKYDAKFDILRFLEISDFIPKKYEFRICNIQTFSLKNNYMEKKRFSNFVEAIEGEFTGRMQLLTDQINAILSKRRTELENKLYILGLDDKISEKKMFEHLSKVLKEHNNWCLEKELWLCEKCKNKAFASSIKEIMDKNKKITLIRTGFGIGTIYQTLIKLVEERDVGLAKNIVNKFKLGRKSRTIDRNTQKELYPPYPKTIEFTDNRPPGWLSCQFYS